MNDTPPREEEEKIAKGVEGREGEKERRGKRRGGGGAGAYLTTLWMTSYARWGKSRGAARTKRKSERVEDICFRGPGLMR